MKISNWEEKYKQILVSPEIYHWKIKRYSERKDEIDAVYESFPFIVTVEASWEEFEETDQLVWNCFGPKNGECLYSVCDFIISCPIVLEVKKEMIKNGKNPFDLTSEEVPEHSHSGCWARVPIAKTGYDYGFGSYCFKNKEDKDKFIKEILNGYWKNEY